MFTNKELATEIVNISEMFNISIETVKYIYEKLSSYPCFDREKGIECLGIACDIREEQLASIRRMAEESTITEFDVPNLLKQPEFNIKRAIDKALLITYDFEVEPNFAQKLGLVK